MVATIIISILAIFFVALMIYSLVKKKNCKCGCCNNCKNCGTKCSEKKETNIYEENSNR